jgi:hypothetical protein
MKSGYNDSSAAAVPSFNPALDPIHGAGGRQEVDARAKNMDTLNGG